MAVLTEPVASPPAPKAAATWPRDLVFAATLGVTMRLIYWLYGWWRLHVAFPYTPIFHGDWANLAPAPGSPGYVLLAPWEHADALWYKHVALAGYQPGNGSVHFPPLFPLAAHLLLPLFRGNFGFAAMTVNLIAAIIGFFLLRRLAALDGRPDDGSCAALFMCAYPVGFFLFAPFSEAMFLVLTVASLYSARKGRWWWAALWGFLATLTRWQGALIAAALAVEYAQQVWQGRRRLGLSLLAIPVPGLAYLGFTLFARFVVGERLSMTQINVYWGIQWLPPWAVIGRGINFIGATGNGTELLNLLALLAGAAACVVGLRFQRLSLVAYTATQTLFAMTHVSAVSPLASSARYMLTVFPVFLLLGRAGGNPRLQQIIVLAFTIFQGIWLWKFTSGEWVA